jgi:hypothetical protein
MPGSILIALAGGPPQVAAAIVALGLALQGIADPTYDVNQFSLRQAVIPPSLQGRVAASVRVVIRGAVPIGALLGGALAGSIGLRDVDRRARSAAGAGDRLAQSGAKLAAGAGADLGGSGRLNGVVDRGRRGPAGRRVEEQRCASA